MMNDNDTAWKFKATIRILFVFGRIIFLIIRIRPNIKDPLFGAALLIEFVLDFLFLGMHLLRCNKAYLLTCVFTRKHRRGGKVL